MTHRCRTSGLDADRHRATGRVTNNCQIVGVAPPSILIVVPMTKSLCGLARPSLQRSRYKAGPRASTILPKAKSHTLRGLSTQWPLFSSWVLGTIYFTGPTAFWRTELAARTRWREILMVIKLWRFLVARSEPDRFRPWYLEHHAPTLTNSCEAHVVNLAGLELEDPAARFLSKPRTTHPSTTTSPRKYGSSTALGFPMNRHSASVSRASTSCSRSKLSGLID